MNSNHVTILLALLLGFAAGSDRSTKLTDKPDTNTTRQAGFVVNLLESPKFEPSDVTEEAAEINELPKQPQEPVAPMPIKDQADCPDGRCPIRPRLTPPASIIQSSSIPVVVESYYAAPMVTTPIPYATVYHSPSVYYSTWETHQAYSAPAFCPSTRPPFSRVAKIVQSRPLVRLLQSRPLKSAFCR